MKKLSFAALLLFAVVPVMAAKKAPPAPQPPPPPSLFALPVALMIAGFDRNGDGEVSRTEYDAGVKGSFGGDGKSMSLIDLSRWAERWLGNAGALPGQFDFDKDEDDKVSVAEYAARFEIIFKNYDADKDGNLKRSELLSQGAPCRVSGGRPDGAKGGLGGGERRGPPPQ